ncbi:enoyl-CoA hydratase/isomerase family protein [Legionella fallonii]|uniref:3-hydroxyisobutyryl-CoA hydrolase n=1 Tax=Legionella fallonii LLAP-10 TaxID=1212491 RepID=A0A098G310_9GAMM|nr:enoyl-CoA hydratase/isomerase family protein [Legionella fallonii]CEG56376.1 3-hydroxyisobutyryl-CoA hydrolase, mitochondrial [Legionella fallonii LLAP-10]
MTDEVLFTREGQLGVITLNRPTALNALTLSMIMELQKQLVLWKEDDSLCAVVVRATSGNAFCAGGDVRWLYNTGRNNQAEQMQFFWHEYRLNHFIHQFGKPYISLMDGITMGGGVGISLHGSHPVASERFVFAMPETSIGFFPDIGASHLLARCPGSLGMYLGLTGNRLGSQDALQAGLVKYTIASEQMQSVINDLLSIDLSKEVHTRVTQCLNKYNKVLGEEELTSINPLINSCFSQSTVESIRKSLSSCKDAWAEKIDNTLNQKCPLSLKITLHQLQKAKGLSLAECLKMDFDLVGHFMKDNDFYEGVRALLIDKDKNPQWNPARLDLVSEDRVVNYFERSTELELIE